MADDAVRHVRLLQVRYFLRAQLDGKGANRVFEVRDLRRSDNGSPHRLLLEQPGERDMHTRQFVLLGKLRDPLHDPAGRGCAGADEHANIARHAPRDRRPRGGLLHGYAEPLVDDQRVLANRVSVTRRAADCVQWRGS